MSQNIKNDNKKYDIIKSNKEKMINHFCKIMNDVNFLLLKENKKKIYKRN